MDVVRGTYLGYILEAYELTKLPEDESVSTHPDFIKAVAFWMVFFIVLHVSFNTAFTYLFPTTFQALPEKKKIEMSTYVISTIHHLVVVPIVTYSLVVDINAYYNNPVPFEVDHMNKLYSNFGVIAFSVGFFCGDGVAYYIPKTLAGSTEGPMYLFHHVLSVVILCSTRRFSGSLLQVLPQLLLIEMSTAFFNIAWLCRCLSNGRIPAFVISGLEYGFALTFFLLRIVNGTLMVTLLIDQLWVASKSFTTAYIMALLLQYFWFYKIIMSVFGGSRKKKAG